MSSDPWPELNNDQTATGSSNKHEWTLRTESELHVERLEAKLDRIMKKKDRTPTSRGSRGNPTIEPTVSEPLDMDAEEIQSGQEEADEGLWLLWNSGKREGRSHRPTSSELDKYHSTTRSSASRSSSRSRHSTSSRSSSNSSSDELDVEDRLEQAKANAKHVEEYYTKDHRSCCCIIS
ncbi:hypothetical protein BGZ94_005703 [Podila epigama]|nr:hypothetical protein BGZ94_005703 [Podila epigama]